MHLHEPQNIRATLVFYRLEYRYPVRQGNFDHLTSTQQKWHSARTRRATVPLYLISDTAFGTNALFLATLLLLNRLPFSSLTTRLRFQSEHVMVPGVKGYRLLSAPTVIFLTQLVMQQVNYVKFISLTVIACS